MRAMENTSITLFLKMRFQVGTSWYSQMMFVGSGAGWTRMALPWNLRSRDWQHRRRLKLAKR